MPVNASIRASWLSPSVILGSAALVVAIVALALAVGARLQEGAPTSEFKAEALFAAPDDVSGLIRDVSPSVATIFCADSQGTGWVLDQRMRARPSILIPDTDWDLYRSNVVTNHHIIEGCIENPASVRVMVGGDKRNAIVYNWDARNDLALIAVSEELKGLPLGKMPKPGWWSMIYGSPFGKPGSIGIGNVINVFGSRIASTAPLNPGNSGSPLVDSLGRVLGTATGRDSDDRAQNWNYVAGLPMLCRKLLDCTGNEFGWYQPPDLGE